MGSLSNLYISQSYQSLIHLATNNTASATLIDLQDGLGNSIGVSVNTGGNLYLSGSLSASLQQGYAWVGDSNNRTTLVPTSSFGGVLPTGTISSSAQITSLGFVSSSVTASSLITASFSGNTLTFTKGDSSTFGVVIPDISGSTIPAGTISGSSQITALGFVSSSITASSLVTASVSLNTITFTKGDASTFNIIVNTGSAITTDITALNSFTQSQETKDTTLASVTSSLNSATASLFTSASLALVTASVNLNTITFTKGDTSTFAITVNTGSGGGGSSISVQDEGSILGDATSFNFNGAGVTATLSAGTASITIPGGGGSIDTGSFATTGSNVFTGIQTFRDVALNSTSLVSTSGSLMLVAKSFTSASSHISGTTNLVNLIFKNNDNTADTIISGSGNMFINPAAPTAGFKRYFGGSGNIALNGSNVPQISGSMQFSPTMNNNYLGGNGTTITMRGPASSSTYTISGNIVQGTIGIGGSAASNAEKLVSGLTMTGNSVIGNLSITANKEFLSASMTVNNNTIGGTVTLTAASSSIIAFSNNIVADNNFNFTNNFYSGSVGASGPQANRNFIIGSSNTFLMTGFADAGGSANYVNSVIGGQSNTIFTNATSASTSAQFYNSIVYGNTLIVSASSNSTTTNGSAFFGRYNANDAIRNRTAGTIFAVGTGTSTGARKTGFLIDSGSNTFIEGTLTVSGSTRITGSLTMSGSILFVDRSGNDTNTYLGLNALGMGSAGAQPLAVSNTIAVAIGQGAMRFASGSNQNVAIGNNALLITSGSKNFAMGSEALSGNTTGASNIAIGTSALQNNKTGDSSTAIGDSAAQFASGSQNTFIGHSSGYNVTGSNNVIIGSYRGVAGEKIDNNIILSDGQQNIKAQYSGSAWSLQDGIKLNKGSNKTTDIVSVNSTLTVSNSLVTATSIILVTTQNSTTGPVYPAVITSKGAGTFDIAHNFGGSLDVAYFIINPT